jgi:hypothetical protein
MNTDEFRTLESHLAIWPKGFENVTCPKALILIGGSMLHGSILTPFDVEQTYNAIGAETSKNHISVYQAAFLMDQVAIWTQQYMEVCDLAAIEEGGREALEHKYWCMQYFKKQRVEFIESLETYRSLELDLDERQSNCEFPELINTKNEIKK